MQNNTNNSLKGDLARHRGKATLSIKIPEFVRFSFRFAGKTVGLVVAANLAWYCYERWDVNRFFNEDLKITTDENGKDSKEHKKALVIPFDCLNLVEHRQAGNLTVKRIMQKSGRQPTIVLEVKELVEIIHEAAADANITSLYADFGEGLRYPMEYAHIEEIRNAVRIFNESHRVHRNPNVNHNPIFAMARNGDPKSSYAFGYSFGWKDYFLASAFSNVYLQRRGYLDLFGTTMSNIFLRSALEKYGVKVHVFKHGDYKTLPNAFSELGYSKSHLEAVKSVNSSINETVQTCIESSRPVKFDDVMWRSIFDYGSLTASNAKEIGLVSAIPSMNPLNFLLDAKNAEKVKTENDFGLHDGISKFTATDIMPLIKYKQMLDRRTRLKDIQLAINEYLLKISELSAATSFILAASGLKPSNASSRGDKVAVVTVDGPIGSSLSYEIINSLRIIKKDKDVKSLVLRVNSGGGSVVSSEAILEELKSLEKPVICSMGNFAASGGYYITTTSERIFAQPTTFTGSIGVFLLKFDASKLAKSYGVRGDYHPHGNHGATAHPLTPLTEGMKNNLERCALKWYDYFKSIVAAGRCLSLDEVEIVSKGRVWTGEQAKEIGLVDTLGGLDRAISYAKSTHTKTDIVSVDYWPKKTLSFADLPELLLSSKCTADILITLRSIVFGEDTDEQSGLEQILNLKFVDKVHCMLTMDEDTAIKIILMSN